MLKNILDRRDPLAEPHPWYVLIETASAEPGAAEAAMERILDRRLRGRPGAGRGAGAERGRGAGRCGALREEQSAAQRPEGRTWKHDISVPVSQMPAFIEQRHDGRGATGARARASSPSATWATATSTSTCCSRWASTARRTRRCATTGSQAIHDIAHELGGSLSAEHGLGVLKTEEALRYKSATELAVMRAIRPALDPKRIMNPRVLF